MPPFRVYFTCVFHVHDVVIWAASRTEIWHAVERDRSATAARRVYIRLLNVV